MHKTDFTVLCIQADYRKRWVASAWCKYYFNFYTAVYCFQKEKHKKPTYRREVMSSTWLSSIFAGQKHVIELVAQSVHKLQVGPFKVSGWEKEPEVWQFLEPGATVLLKQVQNHGSHCPVSKQQAQPVASKVQVTLGEFVEADRVIVTDSDCRESQFFGPFSVDSRICGKGKPVE